MFAAARTRTAVLAVGTVSSAVRSRFARTRPELISASFIRQRVGRGCGSAPGKRISWYVRLTGWRPQPSGRASNAQPYSIDWSESHVFMSLTSRHGALFCAPIHPPLPSFPATALRLSAAAPVSQRMPEPKNWRLLRPLALLRHRARSAFFNSVSPSPPSSGYTLAPTLTVICKS